MESSYLQDDADAPRAFDCGAGEERHTSVTLEGAVRSARIFASDRVVGGGGRPRRRSDAESGRCRLAFPDARPMAGRSPGCAAGARRSPASKPPTRQWGSGRGFQRERKPTRVAQIV